MADVEVPSDGAARRGPAGRGVSGLGRTPAPRVDRREQILDAAAQVLAEGGLGAATVRAVAARAGIGASTMRYWFPTQDQLSAAVAQRVLTGAFRDERIADAGVPAPVRLVECLAQFLPPVDQVPAVGEQQVGAWLVLITSAVGPGASSMGRALYASGLAASRTAIEGWLVRLADEGALERADITRSAVSLLTRIDGLMLGLALPGSTLDLHGAHQILREDAETLLAPER